MPAYLKLLGMLPPLLVLWGCKEKKEYTKVESRPIAESIYSSGRIKAEGQHELYATVNGILVECLVQKGEAISNGQPLFLLENQASKLGVEDARVAMQSAKDRSRKNSGILKELALNVRLAKEQLSTDSIMYERQKQLWKKGIGAELDLEQKRLAYTRSKTSYAAAKMRLSQQAKDLQESYVRSKNRLELSQSQASDYLIRSSMDGMLYEVLKDPGELVSPQSPLAIIGSSNEYLLELGIDEYDIAKAKLGQRVFFSMDSYQNEVFEAILSRIDPIMNQQTRSFNVEAKLVKQPEKLYPNLSVEANILIFQKDSALTIPRSYLVQDSMVVDKNRELKVVKVGLQNYELVEILAGLSEGEVIYKP